MKDLDIYIEIKGRQVKAGEIRAAGNTASGGAAGSTAPGRMAGTGAPSSDTGESVFRYSDEYMAGTGGRQGRPISISLPLQKEPFTPEQTRNFFSGLLPEGFMRRRVSELVHVGEDDYTEILADLGRECIGAIKALPVEPGEAVRVSGTDSRQAIQASGADSLPAANVSGEDVPGNNAEYVRLSRDEIASLAGEGVVEASELVMKAHLSLTGASGKVGLYLDPETKEWFLPVGEAPSTHIVKQSHIRLGGIIANEQLCLMTAKKLGIDVPKSFIIEMGGSRDSQVLLATERFDRKWPAGFDAGGKPVPGTDAERKRAAEAQLISGHVRPYRLHQEDFAQALGIPAKDKYEAPGDHYLGKAFKLLLDYSARPVEDQIKLWKIVVFDYLIGNTDNHIKNISLLYDKDIRSCRLAPAYDMLSTSIYEMSTDNMAFSIGGDMSIADITRDSFGREARMVGINETAAYRQFDRMAKGFVKALEASADELTRAGFANAEEIKERILETGGISRL